jgi:uncharacterized LabA/DUF88 family protein
MDNRGYFIIDGSHLLMAIRKIWIDRPEFKGRKLNVGKLATEMIWLWGQYVKSSVRVIFYFKKDDHRIDELLEIPKSFEPGKQDHWQIKKCGISFSSLPQEEILKLDEQYHDLIPRGEKGLDIKLACDALKLVMFGKADNLVFLVNDRDYIPLIESIQELGANTYLTALDSIRPVQKQLSEHFDMFLTLDSRLGSMFEELQVPSATAVEDINNKIDDAVMTGGAQPPGIISGQ